MDIEKKKELLEKLEETLWKELESDIGSKDVSELYEHYKQNQPEDIKALQTVKSIKMLIEAKMMVKAMST